MKTRLLALSLLILTCLLARVVLAQTTLSAPYVLGCSNPAPAAVGAPTVWPNPCKTTAFMPLTTSSIVGSVSKTAPQWSHTYSGYNAAVQLVACPIGANLSADRSKCTQPGTTTDASALVAQSAVAAFSIVPVTPIPTTQDYSFSWGTPLANTDGSKITDLTAYLVSTASTSIGPFLVWTMVSSSITSYTYKALPTAEPACFAIAGFSASLGAGTPAIFCRPSVMTSPAAPLIAR